MTKFIKFTNRIVNTAFIRYVDIDKPAEKFTIHLDPYLQSSYFFLGTGYFGTELTQTWASKKEYPESYATIEKWIQSMECVSNKTNKP
jgi:hypothetical protein